MKVADFLQQHDLTGRALAQMLGYEGSEVVNRRRREDADIPDAWYPKLIELGFDVDGTAPRVQPTGENLVDADARAEYRQNDTAPQAPKDAPQAPKPVQVDYRTVAGYIEGAYKMGAQMVIVQMDPLMAECVSEHAAQAGQAWANWIQSEPKVAALLERMMIGTPAGEVIGVHFAIGFSYFLARATARELAERAYADSSGQASQHGAPEPPAGDDVAGAAV